MPLKKKSDRNARASIKQSSLLPFLVVDVSALTHRAKHTTGNLDYGIIYGFLKMILSIGNKFRTNRCIFMFDHPQFKRSRKEKYPEYKANRKKDWSSEEYQDYVAQVGMLREWVLPTLGFRNINIFPGLEADDLIYHFVYAFQKEYSVIVSSDHDLFQCLFPRVKMFSPASQTIITGKMLKEETGIPFNLWWYVKAIAGCSSDNVQGVKGVGEKTAAKYLLGKLDADSVKHKAIVHPEAKERVTKNIELCKLPWDIGSTAVMQMFNDQFSKSGFYNVCERLRFQSFMDNVDQWQDFFMGRFRRGHVRKKEQEKGFFV